jgi:Arc/MetJ-type ribon-helix-helix transcriptional regulator
MNRHLVALEINQQQAELLDRLVAEGVGTSRSEVVRIGFNGFCQDLLTLLEPAE